MAFRVTDEHLSSYYHHGYCIFRGVIPAKLLTGMRAMSEQARRLAREKNGPQAQRLQPLNDRGLDLSAYEAFLALPEFVTACQFVLGPHHQPTGPAHTGLLFEPADAPWCTNWHRDITAASKGVDPEEFARITLDHTFFTQVNCALYTDTDLWYVPGSDGRPNRPSELAAASTAPDLKGLSHEEAEYAIRAYCERMPGAINVILHPGDYMLYRPNGWHIGAYAPYRKRATLHTAVWKPETVAWYQRWAEAQKKG